MSYIYHYLVGRKIDLEHCRVVYSDGVLELESVINSREAYIRARQAIIDQHTKGFPYCPPQQWSVCSLSLLNPEVPEKRFHRRSINLV